MTVIHVSLSGALTKERYEFLENELDKLIAKHGMLRIMLVLEGLDGLTPPAMKEDLQFELRHMTEIDRVAVAFSTRADRNVPEWAIPLTDMNTRFFPLGETEKAVAWLKE